MTGSRTAGADLRRLRRAVGCCGFLLHDYFDFQFGIRVAQRGQVRGARPGVQLGQQRVIERFVLPLSSRRCACR